MNGKPIPFLSFKGIQTEAALAFYKKVFPKFEIKSVTHYPDNEAVLTAEFTLMGQDFLAMDCDFDGVPEPNWSVSFYLELESEELYDQLFEQLSDKGNVIMSETNFNHWKKLCWVTDTFGVTWQLLWK